ncbi:hypothetical protein DFH09DRAFT_1089150 [Mycena vulgaris]|nr:hypothetical protein DFH09DRAFT_1089150 [Mycena vulgaris]
MPPASHVGSLHPTENPLSRRQRGKMWDIPRRDLTRFACILGETRVVSPDYNAQAVGVKPGWESASREQRPCTNKKGRDGLEPASDSNGCFTAYRIERWCIQIHSLEDATRVDVTLVWISELLYKRTKESAGGWKACKADSAEVILGVFPSMSWIQYSGERFTVTSQTADFLFTEKGKGKRGGYTMQVSEKLETGCDSAGAEMSCHRAWQLYTDGKTMSPKYHRGFDSASLRRGETAGIPSLNPASPEGQK